jgi:hypothetical protein
MKNNQNITLLFLERYINKVWNKSSKIIVSFGYIYYIIIISSIILSSLSFPWRLATPSSPEIISLLTPYHHTLMLYLPMILLLSRHQQINPNWIDIICYLLMSEFSKFYCQFFQLGFIRIFPFSSGLLIDIDHTYTYKKYII